MNKKKILIAISLIFTISLLCGCNEQSTIDDTDNSDNNEELADEDFLELTSSYSEHEVDTGPYVMDYNLERCYTITLTNNADKNLKSATVLARIYDVYEEVKWEETLTFNNILSGESDEDFICVYNTYVGGDRDGVTKPFIKVGHTLLESEFYTN